jgi:GNAT superfamily N-acetyltransferase
MAMASMEIRTVSTEDSKNDIQRFYDIMIHGYAVTEVEIWGVEYKRMFSDEFEAIISKGELLGAWIDGVPVGSIHVYGLTDNTCAFGLFSVDFDFKGKNIGRKLIVAAEEQARKNGADFMELEILRLKNKELEVKQRLNDWYVRLGYELISTTDFVNRKPDKAEKVKNFIAPSVFDFFRKSLN